MLLVRAPERKLDLLIPKSGRLGRGAMSTASDWRSQAIAEETANLDYADFAQEFLRHNKTYRHDYARLTTKLKNSPPQKETLSTGFARRWGLVFSRRSLCVGRESARALAA